MPSPEVRLPFGRLVDDNFHLHALSSTDLDQIARGEGSPQVVRRLRSAERSRRLLLLRALLDEVCKAPELSGPLPSPESAWELLVRVQEKAPVVLDRILSHPYTGSWVGYTTRLLADRITGVCPLWVHVGHMHAIAAAAAILADLNFEAEIPVWYGGAMLPTIGFAMLATGRPAVATVRANRRHITVRHGPETVALPADRYADGSGWLGVRRLSVRSGGRTLSVRLDDLDPYRGLYEPVPPQRLDEFEVETWQELLGQAWRLVVQCLPDLAEAMPEGLDSLVPRPAVPFRQPSASTGEAFGSAIVGLPADGASLAATLVHEFQHIRLGGVLHLVQLHDDDRRERFYTGWRDDPRPIGGVLQGVTAFFGVTAFWRAMAAQPDTQPAAQRTRAEFEFAYWRAQTWRTLQALRRDAGLTAPGHRFVDGIAAVLGPWQREPVTPAVVRQAEAAAADHHAGWRMRFIRPDTGVVAQLTDAWHYRHQRAPAVPVAPDPMPTPVPDGTWSRARSDLIRLRVGESTEAFARTWSMVPGATVADLAYATGRFLDAVRSYRAELAADPDRPSSWVGLGLALAGHGNGAAARTLLRWPELVRAVHRAIRNGSAAAPAPDELAAWLWAVLR